MTAQYCRIPFVHTVHTVDDDNVHKLGYLVSASGGQDLCIYRVNIQVDVATHTIDCMFLSLISSYIARCVQEAVQQQSKSP
jgi:hypothetical protein